MSGGGNGRFLVRRYTLLSYKTVYNGVGCIPFFVAKAEKTESHRKHLDKDWRI